MLGRRDDLGATVEALSPGQTAEVWRQIGPPEVLLYMGVSGDLNPLYVDAQYASHTRFERPIVPPNLISGLVAGAVATELPGRGALIAASRFNLLRPVSAPCRLRVRLTVRETHPERNQVALGAAVDDEAGQAVLEGELVVEPPSRPRPYTRHLFENF